jgi:hypothetical protein
VKAFYADGYGIRYGGFHLPMASKMNFDINKFNNLILNTKIDSKNLIDCKSLKQGNIANVTFNNGCPDGFVVNAAQSSVGFLINKKSNTV